MRFFRNSPNDQEPTLGNCYINTAENFVQVLAKDKAIELRPSFNSAVIYTFNTNHYDYWEPIPLSPPHHFVFRDNITIPDLLAYYNSHQIMDLIINGGYDYIPISQFQDSEFIPRYMMGRLPISVPDHSKIWVTV